MEFYTAHPTAMTSWRLAVLMGVNSRTYKFALADALLHFARQGRDDVPLADLAAHYSLRLVEHLDAAPQGPAAASRDSDFLGLAAADAEVIRASGEVTARLLDAAERNMPAMVMTKFHNLKIGQLPHRFYEVQGSVRRRTVLLLPELHEVAAGEGNFLLDEELNARWSIVETSFAAGVGASLVQDGLLVDVAEHELTEVYRLKDVARRRSVAGAVRPSLGSSTAAASCATCR